MRVSDRIGATQPPPLQVEAVSPDLVVALWNCFAHLFQTESVDDGLRLAQHMYANLRWPVDEVAGRPQAMNRIKEWFMGAGRYWYEILNFAEFVPSTVGRPHIRDDLIQRCNVVLKAESSAYLFSDDGVLAPISNEHEMAAVQAAAQLSDDRFTGARTHVRTAMSLLSKKPDPDYRNSVKESISAVESVVKVIGENPGGGIRAALDKLNTRTPLHGALRSGICSLYGYTSNEGGIRHAILDQDRVEREEAIFMLVACSALVHYLVAKAVAPETERPPRTAGGSRRRA